MQPVKLREYCVGLDLYKARNRILQLCPELDACDIDVTFNETEYKRFIVTDCVYDAAMKKVRLQVTSCNPIRHLPSNYQSNEFLRQFLMIFQHISNEVAVTLDNLHEFFRPMECPADFLYVLADWFGISLETLGGETEIRRFLQYAVPLFKYRGTRRGLQALLFVVSGIVPEIIEGSIPYTLMEITYQTEIGATILETEDKQMCFTVYFPVLYEHLDSDLVQRLSLLIQQEKPVHTKCFMCFKKPELPKRSVTVFSDKTTFDAEGGIQF